MATNTNAGHAKVRELTEDEWQELIDQEARRYLNMSGEEFIRRWRSGEIDPNDPETHSAVIRVGMLVGPFGR